MISREDTIRREDILRELELLPTWRLRQAPNTIAENVAIEDRALKIAVVEKTPLEHEAEINAPMADPLDKEVFIETESFPVKESTSLAELSAEIALPLIDTSPVQTVFGVGDPNAEWLFVGVGPDAEEGASGEPFAGQTGQLLDNMLIAMHLRRGQNVYLANVLNCPPQDNQDRQEEALTHWELYFKQQVARIKPKLIIALGELAAQSLLQAETTLASMRGQVHDYQGVPLIVTYHPTDLLHSPKDKPKAWDDLCFARKTMLTL